MTVQKMKTPSLLRPLPSSESPAPNTLDNLDDKQTKNLISWVRSEFDKAKSARWKDERQWFLNLAMYFGKQNIAITDTQGKTKQFKLYTPPAPYYRARPVINRIRPIIRTEVAKLTSQRPSAFVIPASSEDRDLYASNAAEQIWESLYENKKIHKVVRRAVWWASITGNGFIKSWWDEDKKDRLSDLPGDICYEAITPFHIFVKDLTEMDIEKQPWVIHASNRSIEAIEMSFGKKLKLGKADSELIDESFVSAMGVETNVNKQQDTVLVIEMWLKPGNAKIMPKGGMITIAGDDIIGYHEGWPYEHGEFPFTHIPHVETGKFYGESVITDLIPLQKEYNRTRGQIIESKNRMAKPQLAAEIGSLDVSKMTNEPGQVVLYRPGFQAPTPIPLQSLPSYVLEEQDRIKMDMDDISGQSEVSRGSTPTGVTAATAISYLQEQSDTRLSSTYAAIEEGLEKIAHHSLVYVKQYWDTPRKVKVTGIDQTFDVLAFEGSDLQDNTDIRMEGGSSLPQSRAGKQAFVMDLMKMGFIDPNKGLEVLEIGGINKIYEQIQIDARQAQRENLRMAQVTPELIMQNEEAFRMELEANPQFQEAVASGMIMEGPSGDLVDITDVQVGGPPIPIKAPLIVPVNSWDDHRLHIEKHNQYRKSQSFESLPQEAKDLFEQHVQAHVEAIMVGAQGAGMLAPGALDMASNPETITEASHMETAEEQTGQEPEMSQPMPEEM